MPRRACLALLLLGLAASARADLVSSVRARAEAGAFDEALALVQGAQRPGGAAQAPEALLARSWIARAALGKKQLDLALREADATYEAATAALKSRPLDAEKRLPLALGAAIEVRAQALAAQGERGRAVTGLRAELARYGATSLAARIQKNLNLLELEGKPALPLDPEPHLGPPLPGAGAGAARKGEVTLLFFWAHWCGDCKAQGPVLERLLSAYGKRGLRLVAPTQPYGSIPGQAGEPSPEAELRYIDEVRRTRYAGLGAVPVPASPRNFTRYGASTVPTLVLIDRAGKVAMYHPGLLTEEELGPRIEAALGR